MKRGVSQVSQGSAAAAAALTVTLPPAIPGQATVITSIHASFIGTTQTSQTILVRVAGGGATRWQKDFFGPAAGFGSFELEEELKFIDGEDLEIFLAAMANCAQKCSVVSHNEIADRTA